MRHATFAPLALLGAAGCGIGAYAIIGIAALGGGGGDHGGGGPAATPPSTAPVVQSLTPSAGPTSGGTVVTITGLRFDAGATVSFATLAASGVTFVSSFILTCTTPSYPQGPVTVTVTNSDAQTGSLAGGFTFQGPAPTLTGVSPAAGPVAGGTTITLAGTNFAPGIAVSVGGAAATFVTYLSSTSVTAVTPAGTMGPATVTATNLDLQAASLPGGFTYQGPAPTLASVSPASGPPAGGTLVTLTGTNFAAGATVTIGGNPASGVTVVSGIAITCTTPPGTGVVGVTVTNVDAQSATLPASFTYTGSAATVLSVLPASGPIAGGTLVTIAGSTFIAGATVTFGAGSATSVTVASTTQITCVTPAGSPGPVNVAVTNPSASPGTLVNGYNYLGPLPTITGVSPAAGPTAGGTFVTVTGTNFFAGATVTFGGSLATSVTVASAFAITCVTPSGTMGPAAVTVTNVDGQGATSGSGYTFQGPAPTLAGVSPGAGPIAGGTAVTLSGSNFASGATVAFGGALATSVTVVSSTTITCVTPSGAMGPASVVVTNVDAQQASLAGGFVFQGAAPTLSTVAPGGGPMAGGTLVTLTGTNFAAGATVTFAGSQATTVSVPSTTQITCVTPAGPIGPANVVVMNVDLQAASLPAGFVFQGPAPTLSSVSPNSGPPGGGTLVTLTGTNFAAGATVTFGGSLAPGATVVSSTQVTCTTPPGSGTVSVVLTNVDGNAATLGFSFTYTGTGATVTSVSPSVGPAAGGTFVTVTGTNFVSGATVTFGGGSATSVVIVSTTQITCVTPSGAAGPVNVTVTNPSASPGTLVNGFTYQGPAPTLTSATPNVGPIAGGTLVTLAGTNFLAGATVTFGGTVATSVTVASTTQITCVTPAHALGPVTVVVNQPDLQSASLASGFTYQGPVPTVSGVSPSAGPTAGGTFVTVTGTNFAAGATVAFGGALATSVAVSSTTTLTCVTPAGTIGPKTVVLTNVDSQSGSLPNGYTFQGPAPALSSVSPNAGPTAGGTLVTLAGTNFAAGATVTFRGASATSVAVASTTTITCVTPAASIGPAPVTVTNVDAQSATLPSGFTFQGPIPTLSSVTPNSGPLAGGTLVTLAGTDFAAGATVTFGAALASGVTVASTTQITCTTPSGGGPVNVVVTNVDSLSATLPNGFTYVGTQATVTSVNPGSGPAAGGTFVTVSGSSFASGATVTFGGATATSVTVAGASTITCLTPAGSPGYANVTVTNPFASPGTLVNGFLFQGPLPTLTGVAPPSGPASGGTAVQLTGTNFLAGATVTFGGTAATGVTVVSSTQINCTTPAHTLGVVTVTITNVDAQSASLPSGFTFLGPTPSLVGVSPAVGPVAGGTRITLTGSSFAAGATVDLGGTPATSVVFVSSSILTATTPAHATGFVTVRATNPDNQVASLPGGFEYRVPPSITTTIPPSGSTNGGTLITVYGSNFAGGASGATVTIGGTPGTAVTVNPAGTELRATTPAGTAGTVNVVVTNPDTLTATQTGGYTYVTAGTNPTISLLDVEPGAGPPSGGTIVTIVGTGFLTVGSTTVYFGMNAASSVTVLSTTTLTAVTPPGTSGTIVDVSVVNPGGLSATARRAFAYATAYPVFAGLVAATAISPYAIELRWAPALDDVSPSRRMRYRIYRATASGGEVFSAPPQYLTDPGVLTFAAGGLSPGTRYWFVVRAEDEAGNADGNTVERDAPTLAGPGAGKASGTGSLGATRAQHTATLLPDGRVIAAGGSGAVGDLVSSEIYDPLRATWIPGATLNVGRADHAAVLLPSGRVLVAGGAGLLARATSELYDPSAAAWTATTGGLATGRWRHTLTLLQNGRVLAAGGASGANPTSSCEIYDPATGTWAATGSLAVRRGQHTATRLADGRVLVAGGLGGNAALTALASCQVYDPSTGTWTATGGMATARLDHTATRLADGRVLAVSGQDLLGVTKGCEVYDPATGTWTGAASVWNGRAMHTATLLPDGSVLAAGGGAGGAGGPVAQTEVYEPISDQWIAAGNLGNPGAASTATLLADGDVLVAGGASSTGSLATAELWEWPAAAGAWHGAASLPAGKQLLTLTPLADGTLLAAGGRALAYQRGSHVYDRPTDTWTATVGFLGIPRAYHTATLLPSGRVLVAAGFSSAATPNQLVSCELYDPATGTWAATGPLAVARYAHTATLLRDGRVLAAGGNGTSGYTATAAIYDPTSGTWSSIASMPSVRGYHTAATLPDGRVLVAGGYGPSALASAAIYDPLGGSWTTTGSLATARTQQAGAVLPGGRVLVVGGGDSLGNPLASAEVYDPATGTWTGAGSLSTARRQHSASLLPSGLVLVAGGYQAGGIASAEVFDPPLVAWGTTGSLATPRGFHAATVTADGSVLAAGGLMSGTGYVASAEVFDLGRGAPDTSRPLVGTVAGSAAFPVTLSYGATVAVTGARFRGVSEASGGHTGSSPTDAPIVVLAGPLGGASGFLESGPGETRLLPLAGPPTDTALSFTTPVQWGGLNPTGLGPGFYRLRVVVNGIPSEARIVRFP